MGTLSLWAQVVLVLLFVHFSKPAFSFTVVIDPGHGGTDNGATKGTIIESKIALSVGLKLAAKLEQDNSFRVILTRSKDNSVTLKQRVKTSNSNDADLFVSLHGNSSTDRRAKGAEFYLGASTPPPSEDGSTLNSVDSIVKDLKYKALLYQSQSLAISSYETWKQSTLSIPRAIKQAPFYVINRNNVPSILVEFGFITNSQESLNLLQDETQDQIAQNLYSAVKNFKNSHVNK